MQRAKVRSMAAEDADMVTELVPSAEQISLDRSGRDRRQHGRWEVSGATVSIEDETFSVVDISIGGFQARIEGGVFHVGQDLDGMLVRAGKSTRNHLDFSARIVRVDDESNLFAAAFEPLEGQQIDRLLSLLSSIDAERRKDKERMHRARDRGRRITRIAVAFTIVAVIAVGAWFGFGKTLMSLIS